MADESKTPEVTMDSLVAKRAELMTLIAEAAIADDAKKLDAAASERRKVDKQIGDFAVNAEKSARDAAIPLMSESLKTIDMTAKGTLMTGVVLSGTLRRGDSGNFDDLKVGVGYEGGETDLGNLLSSAINMSAVKDLTSVKGINFVVSREGVKIEYTGRAPSGGGGTGTGGKGWYREGVKHSLNDVFEMRANDEDREKLAAANGDGNKQYSVKQAVAKRQDDFVLGD